MQFCEMWLAEEINNQPEGRKIGVFCSYDGLSGELLQVFRINEVQLKGSKDPEEGAIDMNKLEESLESNGAWIDSATMLKGSSSGHNKYAAISQSSLIDEVLLDVGYKKTRGKAVRIVDIMTGESSATSITCNSVKYYFPEHRKEDYFSCQFEDGVYVRIPRRLTPYMKTFGMEIGCYTMNGDFHRLLAVGDREKGAIHTTVYERFDLVRSKVI